MSDNNLKTSISIPLWQLIATALLLYLLPPPQSVEIFLLLLLKHKESVLAVKILAVVLIILSFCYLKQKSNRPLSSQERNSLLKNIKDVVEAQYLLHTRNVLAKNFDELLNNEASRGFTFPTGALAGAISDLYISDIGVFSEFIEDAISKATSNINTKTLHQYLSVLVNKMLTKHNSDIKALYNRFTKGYYENTGTKHINIINTSFASQADSETKQRIKHLLSANNLDKIT